MDIGSMTIDEFTGSLASSAPVPGGGATSSLAGAMGVSLGLMVAHLTEGKKKYAEFEERVQEIIPELEAAKKEFLRLSEEDEINFLPLSRAYKLPRNTEEERRIRDEVMESGLRLACDAPLKSLELALKTSKLLGELCRRGSRLAISDTGAGVKLLEAALSASLLNVLINTDMMKDRGFAEELNKKAIGLFNEGRAESTRVYEEILERLYRGSVNQRKEKE